MKVKKFNETFGELPKTPKSNFAPPPPTKLQSQYNDNDFPFKCKLKHRNPDPGICYVTEIYFREKKIEWSNGAVSSMANFEDVEFIPDIFIFDKYNL